MMIAARRGWLACGLGAMLVVCVVTWLSATPAWALEPGTGWAVTSSAYPTNLPPGGSGRIQIEFLNAGAKPSAGGITVTDTLPEGVTATAVGGFSYHSGTGIETAAEEALELGGPRWLCIGNGSGEHGILGADAVTCTSNPTYMPALPVLNSTSPSAYGFAQERLAIEVEVAEHTAEGARPNSVTVGGGGAKYETEASDPVTIGAAQPAFGFSAWDVWFTNADGTIDTQAGSHPYDMTAVSGFNQLASGRMAGGEARNLEVDLPPGLFGDPGAVPQCTRTQLDGNNCPADTQIGVDVLALNQSALSLGPGGSAETVPVFNMVPPPGVPDEFALSEAGRLAFFDAGIRNGSGYGLVEHVDNVPQAQVEGNILTLWGVPAEASHNGQRQAATNNGTDELGPNGCLDGCAAGIIPKPFLTLPTSCAGPQTFAIHGLGTWQQPNVTAERSVETHDTAGKPVGFTGCEQLSVEPSLSAVPDSSFADTPAGLTVNVRVPQGSLEVPGGRVASTIKDTTVTLPEGLVINPGQAAGLQACQPGDVAGGDDLPLPGEDGEEERFDAPAQCPGASKVGTVKIKTPLLEGELESELEGDVYVLQSNPPNLQLLLAASGDGLNLKLVGNVHLNEATGQLTTTFDETPELPFTSFELSFNGGAQAALATPTVCGTYTTTSDFTPWTSPFAPELFPSSSFQVSSGANGGACPSLPLPFGPSLIAGSTTDQAGGYTAFSLLLQRGDDQQRIERLQFKAPAGLSGMIGAVAQCPEPQASKGECSEASRIGYATVASGPGPYPLVIPQPGDPESPIFLTGPYEGAPFGLSIVTHVLAGPFDLGTIVTRARIEIDPLTAQITVTTGPLPQVVAGVPTDLRLIDSVVDRSGFMFNPTNCDASSFSGTAWGTPPPGMGGPGASAPIESRFQVGSCQSLKFKPTFKVSTSAHTSRVDGASLHVSLTLPNEGGLGTEANVRKVKVSLPKKLPTPLTTLQKACPAATFAANPASCPVASRVAQARVSTPVLPGGLSGPAYFVSHGGAGYPELIIVLAGENGVTVQVHGETFISKAGITTGTFSTAPDVPFTSFELAFPQGRYPAFTANGNLCKGTLVMPTEMVGQNGYVITQRTKIAVTGCPKRATHKQKTRRKRIGKKDRA